jgi:hypothetical protein
MSIAHLHKIAVLLLLILGATNCDAGTAREVNKGNSFNSGASAGYYSSQTRGNNAFDCKLCPREEEGDSTDCIRDCPVPFKYIKNEGQLRRTLLAYELGPEYCRYAINQEIIHSFKSEASYAILLSNDTVKKNLYKEYIKEIKEEAARAPFYYYPLYLFDFYASMIAFAIVFGIFFRQFVSAYRKDRIVEKESQPPQDKEPTNSNSTHTKSSLRTYTNPNDANLTKTVRPDGRVAFIRKKNE